MTALAWAAQDNRKQAVDVLLKGGANPNIQNKVPILLHTSPAIPCIAEISCIMTL